MPKGASLVLLALILAIWGGLSQAGGQPYPAYSGDYGGVGTVTQTRDHDEDGSTVEAPLYYENHGPLPGELPHYGPSRHQPPPYPPAGVYAPQHLDPGLYPPGGPVYAQPKGFASPQPGVPEQKAEPIQVQVEHVVVQKKEVSGAPIVRGHGLFFLGVFAVIVCLVAVHTDPAAENKKFGEAIGMNIKSLVKGQDFMRSLLVVVTLILSPILLVVSLVRLAMTLPKFLVWAWKNDEISFAQIGLAVLYVWLLFLDPNGKSKTAN